MVAAQKATWQAFTRRTLRLCRLDGLHPLPHALQTIPHFSYRSLTRRGKKGFLRSVTTLRPAPETPPTPRPDFRPSDLMPADQRRPVPAGALQGFSAHARTLLARAFPPARLPFNRRSSLLPTFGAPPPPALPSAPLPLRLFPGCVPIARRASFPKNKGPTVHAELSALNGPDPVGRKESRTGLLCSCGRRARFFSYLW